MKTKTIQEALEKKARKRAEEEIKEALNAFMVIRGSDFFSKTKIEYNGEKTSLRSLFWWVDSELIKPVVDELHQKYIPEEVGRFIKQTEELKNELDTFYE